MNIAIIIQKHQEVYDNIIETNQIIIYQNSESLISKIKVIENALDVENKKMLTLRFH